ncbi:MAG: hypothetical protein H6608_03430 [Flavobacteriales bacterium]|nr:hypothetical protein [Bacteroidota bacterium]MCB9240157.1 hypothetical protein [Flavobacteriales bacterium]
MFAILRCNRSELSGLEHSGMLTIGDENDIEVNSLVPDPRGGFLLGASSRRHQRAEVLIQKYDEDFKLEWEQTIGDGEAAKLLYAFLDRDYNTLVVNLTLGYNADTVSLQQHKFWRPVAYLLNPQGEIVWEKMLVKSLSAYYKSGSYEKVTDMVQDENGDYLLCGDFYSSTSTENGPKFFKLIPEFDRMLVYDPPFNRAGAAQAIYPSDGQYVSFNYWRDSSNALNKTASIGRLFPLGAPTMLDRIDLPWPWDQFNNGSIGQVKLTHRDGTYSFNYVFESEVYRYRFNRKVDQLTEESVPINCPGLIKVVRTFDEHLILLYDDGRVEEVDEDFVVLNSFTTDVVANHIIKNYHGDYICSVQRDKVVYVMKLNSKGVLQ